MVTGTDPAAAVPITDEECRELLSGLDAYASKEQLEAAGFEPLTVGFANLVCGTEKNGSPLILKRYTDLVFLRLTPESVGAVDVYASRMGHGPRVFHSSTQGIVMERKPGETLCESDMHSGDFALLELVANALADFHVLPVPEVCAGEPMLWRTIDKMMEVVKTKPNLMPEGVPSLDEILDAIEKARCALNQHQPKVVLGHGDFKPSNVIRYGDSVTMIDFELAGPNYRGFDLMKVFRTALPMSENCMHHFLRSYAQRSGESGSSERALECLLQETRRFEPLTWLEAAVFFLTLPQFKPTENARWHHLAADRWAKFEQTKHLLSSSTVGSI